MDFGDIIYVVLAIVFSAAGAMSKRKKKKVISSPPTQGPSRDIFEEFFDFEEEVEDPIESLPIEEVIEEKPVPKAYDSSVYEPLYTVPETQPQEEPVVKSEAPKSPKEKTAPRHYILDELQKRSEVKKALIYSEILKPKF